MDVQCERCKTEYEFDDALVSGRGTTVKCTNCGLQFKVRPNLDHSESERWIVHTVRGQPLVFTSLRELQRAITTHEVGRGDTLSRGNAPPRTLGTIAELEPFFLARPPAPPAEGRSKMPTLRPPPAIAVPPAQPPARLAPVGAAPVNRAAPAYAEAATLLTPPVQRTPAPSVVSRQPTLPQVNGADDPPAAAYVPADQPDPATHGAAATTS